MKKLHVNSAAQVFELDYPNRAATVSIIYQLIPATPIEIRTPIVFNIFPLE